MPPLRRSGLFLCLLLTLAIPAWAQWSRRVVGTTSLAFSPNGQYLAVGNTEDWASPGDFTLWDVRTGRQIRKVRYSGGVKSLAFLPDGQHLALITEVEYGKQPIRLWNLRSWRIERQFGVQQLSQSLAVSPNGQYLAAGGGMAETGDSDEVYFWNLRRRTYRILPQSYGPSELHFSPDGQLLGVFHNDYDREPRNLRLWRANGRLHWSRPLPGLTDAAFLPDGRTLLAATANRLYDEKTTGGTLRLLSTSTGRLLQTIKRPEKISALAISRDGKTWATGDSSGTVRLWDTRTRRITRTLKLHQKMVLHLAFSPDARFLASAGDDNTVRLTHVR